MNDGYDELCLEMVTQLGSSSLGLFGREVICVCP